MDSLPLRRGFGDDLRALVADYREKIDILQNENRALREENRVIRAENKLLRWGHDSRQHPEPKG